MHTYMPSTTGPPPKTMMKPWKLRPHTHYFYISTRSMSTFLPTKVFGPRRIPSRTLVSTPNGNNVKFIITGLTNHGNFSKRPTDVGVAFQTPANILDLQRMTTSSQSMTHCITASQLTSVYQNQHIHASRQLHCHNTRYNAACFPPQTQKSSGHRRSLSF